MNALTVFAFESHAVRCLDRDGAPWFVATDVASVLGYRDAPNMIRMLDEDEAATHIVSSRSADGVEQDRQVSVISESGLYACILKSRRPEAVPFRKWVTAEVLPSIRKTGAYQQPDRELPAREVSISVQHQADVLVSADRTFRSVMRSCRTAGLTTGAAIRRAHAVTLVRTGIDVVKEWDLPLAPEPPAHVTLANEPVQRWLVEARQRLEEAGACCALTLHAHASYWGWTRAHNLRALPLPAFVTALRAVGVEHRRERSGDPDTGQVSGPHGVLFLRESNYSGLETRAQWMYRQLDAGKTALGIA